MEDFEVEAQWVKKTTKQLYEAKLYERDGSEDPAIAAWTPVHDF